MQTLTAPPRDALTEDQVTYLLRDSPSITPQRGLELLDLSLRVVEDISDDFLGGSVTRANLATIHGTCSLVIARDIDYGQQLLRPYLVLSYGGLSARFNGGVYVPRKPASSYDTSIPSNAITGSDRLFQLNRPVGDAYQVLAGVRYIDAIRQVLLDAGIDASNILIDSSAEQTLPASRSWPLLASTATGSTAAPDVVSDSGSATSWLRIVNDLAGSINYRGLWVDADGYFRSDPYRLPSQRPPEFTFDFDDPMRSIIGIGRTKNRDTSTVPNVWIFQQQNLANGTGSPLLPAEGAGQYTVENYSDGDTSINARGGDPIGRYAVVVPLDVADQATLVAKGNQQVASDKAVAVSWAVTTSPFPAAWHEDVYLYSDIAAAEGQVRVQSTCWTLDYGTSTTPPADQQHTWQLVAA